MLGDHDWVPAGTLRKRGKPIASSMQAEHGPARVKTASHGEFCSQCGAWRGVLGLEPTVDLYITHMVEVMREGKRVLRDDGTVWLNIGDSYDPKSRQRLLVPHRLALALQADGWLVRSDIIWAKGVSYNRGWAGSVMPESVRDRPTCAHEHVLLLAKRGGYYYDYESAREPGVVAAGTKAAKGSGTREGNRRGPEYAVYDGLRNPRDVWAIGTRPFKEAHFATFPPDLIRPILAAGAPLHCCPECQKPYRRVVERSPLSAAVQKEFHDARIKSTQRTGRTDGHTSYKPSWAKYRRTIVADGWRQQCQCSPVHPELDAVGADDQQLQVAGGSDGHRDTDISSVAGNAFAGQSDIPVVQGRHDSIGGTVLDPFCGSGTVGVVCIERGLRFIGVDASAAYLTQIALPRLAAAESAG